MLTGELAGRCAIISGGSRGIGEACAHLLARNGAMVVLTGREPATGEPVAAAIRSGGGKAVFVTADNASEADWVTVVAAAEQEFGRVDILVANAGTFERARTVNLSLEDFRRVSRNNLKGPFLALKHSVAAMRRGGRGGSVVMLASVTAHKGMPERIHYVASKAGVNLLAKAAALELGA